MKKKTISNFSKIILLVVGLVCSLFVSTILADLLLYNSLNLYSNAIISLIVGAVIILLFTFLTRLYSASLLHASVTEIIRVALISAALLVSLTVVNLIEDKTSFPWAVIVSGVFFIFACLIISSCRVMHLIKIKMLKSNCADGKKVLIVGAGIAGTTILREIQTSDKLDICAVGFVDDDPHKIGTTIMGIKVLGNCEQIVKIAKDTAADLIIIAIPTTSAKNIKRISQLCLQTNCEVKTLPGLYQLIDGDVSVSRLRDVDVQDLLGRDPVKVNLDEVMGYIEEQVVLVTGGGGSIGSELCRQIATHNPKQLIILDIYENNAYEIEQELKRKLPNLNLLTLIASIRDSGKMDDVFKTYHPDIVFHAAAHKHVPLMETSPNEAVKNNVLGTYKVVKCADKYGVKKFVQISTDKAVNPTNIMGATKRVCEMIIQAFSRKSKTQFVAVRFGNVLGSNGSVIPLFKKQIAEGGPVTVTHKDIIRYFMTIPEAVSLVLQAGAYANGGEIFVLDMGEQVKIYDLAVNLIKLSGYEPDKDIEIKVTGLRPGEKLYEERLMAEEGLEKTANDRISIGKPIEMDDEHLFATLEKLYDEAYSESEKMKDLVKELVPTYKIDRRSV
ncbi:MAG: polysaccharide biosynthesis protein [Ruminococcaceae bacterium]|nr:polysaccharide biosynthesis protein [Oscillospiraceae bacterium]